MENTDSSEAVSKSSAQQLLQIINLDEATPDLWSERDQAAMLRHQLSSPLEVDLSSLGENERDTKAPDGALAAAASARIKTFQDLFDHPAPPVAVLSLAKDFFKRQAGASAERRPEQEVAYFLYLLTVLVARVRVGTNVTKLSDADLLKGIKWAVNQKWVDAKTRKMCAEASRQLEPAV
jgi:hypothetical protein